MSAFKRRTFEPPLMNCGKPVEAKSSKLIEWSCVGEPAIVKDRKLGDTANSCIFRTRTWSSAVEGSREQAFAEVRRSSSHSKRCSCSAMRPKRDSCSVSKASRMPSATTANASIPKARPKGRGGKPISGVLQPLMPPQEEGGRVDGVLGGVDLQPDVPGRSKLPLPPKPPLPPRPVSVEAKYSRRPASRNSGRRSSRTWPQASACVRMSSAKMAACLLRRSRCCEPQNSICFRMRSERSSFCCSKSVMICRRAFSSSHIDRFFEIKDSPTSRFTWVTSGR
mmetsp:Transcript_68657/g.223410  ORF Transcript_68657/g.223410 Transcript_68657/m.223410 type:complete len:280 (-) Transcript_68657:193-1032(-)